MDNTVHRISKMCSQLAAPLVDNYIQTLNRNSSIVNENTIKIMKELFAELKIIKSCGDNERRELWLEVPKGTIADFGDYETAKEYGDVENYEEFEKWWKEEYPDDVYWYHLVTLENEGYMAVFLKNRMVLEVNPHWKEEQYDRLGDAVNPFVEWLTASVKCCINQMQEGTYNEYVKTHLTPENRTGTIIRNDYWRAFPEVKENYLKNFSKSDYGEFIRLMDGVKDILSVVLIIAVARGASVLMAATKFDVFILDSASKALNGLSPVIFAPASYVLFLVLSFLIPSTSGLASVAFPVLGPLTAALKYSPEVMVLIFSAASGVINLITPTSGVVMGGLATARVQYTTWIKFVSKLIAIIVVMDIVILTVAMMIIK